MNGGVLNIKNTRDFHEDYVDRVKRGDRLYICEKRSHTFTFYIDFDYYGEEDLDYLAIFIIVCGIVNHGECVIAKSGTRVVKGVTKHGFHLVWPTLHVNHASGETIRQKILNNFGEDEWPKMFDSFSSCLRMLWSYKNDAESTWYEPWGYIQNGEFKEFEDSSPSVEFLEKFTIRQNSDCKESIKTDSIDDGYMGLLERFIQVHVRGQEKARLLHSNVTRNSKGIWISTNSKYCENIKREHKSNHVFFIIQNGILQQRCLDSLCQNFKGRGYAVPKTIKELCNNKIKWLQ
jgi:hypothetical protein